MDKIIDIIVEQRIYFELNNKIFYYSYNTKEEFDIIIININNISEIYNHITINFNYNVNIFQYNDEFQTFGLKFIDLLSNYYEITIMNDSISLCKNNKYIHYYKNLSLLMTNIKNNIYKNEYIHDIHNLNGC